MIWPALRPDLNPVEHLLNEIQRQCMKSNQGRQLQLNLMDPSWGLGLYSYMAFINSLIHAWRCIVVINDKDNPDTYFRSLFLLHL